MEGKGAFTFLWQVKNLWKSEDRMIPSPRFVVEALEQTEWQLELQPGVLYADEHMSCHLRRHDDDNGPDNIDVDFEISLTSDGVENRSVRQSRFVFKKGDSFPFEEFALRRGLFQQSHATFTFSCRMWTPVAESVGRAAQCSARTHMADKKIMEFAWTVENISSQTVCPTRSVSPASSPSMALKMSLKNGTYRVKGFKADVKGIDSERVLVFVCEIRVLGAKGNEVTRDLHRYPVMKGKNDYEWHIPLYITKETLMASGDTLTFLWECRNIVIDVNEIQYPQRRSFKTQN